MDFSDLKSHAERVVALGLTNPQERKYWLKMKDGSSFLMRVGKPILYPKYQQVYNSLNDLASLDEKGIPKAYYLTKTVDSATLVVSYTEGHSLDTVLPKASRKEQESLGAAVGELLAAIHSLTPESLGDIDSYEVSFKKTISAYIDLALYLPGEKETISYILANMHDVMYGNGQSYVHGSLLPRHIVLKSDGKIGFINFMNSGIFEPFYDFSSLETECAKDYPAFAKALMDSYFKGNPPARFFIALAFYSALEVLKEDVELCAKGKSEEAEAKFAKLVSDFSSFADPIPLWYKKG